MEDEVLDCLDDLGYDGDIKDEASLKEAIEGPNGGPRNLAYTQTVAWVTGELKVLCMLEEEVTCAATPDDHAAFLMEVSAFLKELGCPHSTLTDGSTSQKLGTRESRLLLLSYLLSELEAARMVSASSKGDQGMKVEMRESDSAKDLKNLLIALGFPRPPNNITSKQLFTKVEDKLSEVKNKAAPSLVGKPLFDGVLSDKQWNMLKQMQEEMNAEYRMRRQMLIKRLDVTIQSFQWSDRAKQRENDITKVFRKHRDNLHDDPSVTLGHLLAAREDLAVLEKTSCASVRKNTKSNLNKVLIGRVPDRGGRAYEHEPPPPEMPSWQKERQSGGHGGRGGRGGGGYNQHDKRGGYNQHDNRGGGYNQHDNRGGGYNHDNRGGGYDNRRGGGYNQHDNRSGGYNQYDNRGGGGYNQYDDRSNNYDNHGGYNQQSRGYNQHDNRGYDNRSHGGRGGGRGRRH